MLAFGDSCSSGDDKYVLAQFRADAELTWVINLRSFLDLKELKYKDYIRQKHRVAANLQLSRRMHEGLKQAEITVIDRPRYQRRALYGLLNSGAEWNVDFSFDDLNVRAAEEMIGDSPIGLIARFGQDEWLFDRMADNTFLGKAKRFSPASLREAAGGKLRDAVVLAARSHAMLSPSETWETIGVLTSFGGSSMAANIKRLERMGRTFDTEHTKSAVVLNGLVEMVAEGTHIHRGLLPMIYKDRSPVEEQSSHQVTHIQAADFAAGWAADLLVSTDGDYRTVAQKFRVLLVNGVVLSE